LKPEVTIVEPATMLSDYLLGVWILFLGHRLWERRRPRDVTTWFMLACFVSSGVAAFAGGTSHGWTRYLDPELNSFLWLLAMAGVGLTGTFLLLATVTSASMGALPRRVWWWGALVTGGVFVVAVVFETTVTTLGIYYGPVVLATAWLELSAWLRTKSEVSRYVLLGVLAGLVSGLTQKYRLGFTEHFNGAVLCHVIFMVAMYCFYRGALLAKDAGSESNPVPIALT
jgi:hypothetical protein